MDKVIGYIREVTGEDVRRGEKDDITFDKLPFFLRKSNEIEIVLLLGKKTVFVRPKQGEYPPPNQLIKQLELIKRELNLPVVYIFPKVDSYSKKKLIKNRVAFVVENSQMYIPFMFIDLDSGKRDNEEEKRISPSSQCMLIYHLLVASLEGCSQSEIASILGYSNMTINRAGLELMNLGLCTLSRTKTKRISFDRDRKNIWEVSLPYLESPVKKMIYVEHLPKNSAAKFSGLTALANYSDISGGRKEKYAIGYKSYRQWEMENSLTTANAKYGEISLEIWKYDPEILTGGNCVDPLSLYLSLREEEDEHTSASFGTNSRRIMVGIEVFEAHFREYQECYIVIGGVACEAHFNEQGLEFRATKDIDIVLVVEAMTDDFIAHFWEFIKLGEYENRQYESRARKYYRFIKPLTSDFPYQLELFSRIPEQIQEGSDMVFTPIPADEELSSLSAILMDQDYYDFTRKNSLTGGSFHRANDLALLCLKVKAYLNLLEVREAGGKVDMKNIKKHRNDVFRLAATLSAADRIELPEKIKSDISEFVLKMSETPPDVKVILKSMGIDPIDPEDLLDQIKQVFSLD